MIFFVKRSVHILFCYICFVIRGGKLPCKLDVKLLDSPSFLIIYLPLPHTLFPFPPYFLYIDIKHEVYIFPCHGTHSSQHGHSIQPSGIPAGASFSPNFPHGLDGMDSTAHPQPKQKLLA